MRADAGAGTDGSCDLARPDALAPGGRRLALSAAATGTEEVTFFAIRFPRRGGGGDSFLS